MNLKVDSYFYTFAPSGSGRFTTEGEHQLSNSRTPQKIGTRRLLRFSRFNANLQILTLVFNQLLSRTRDRIITLYFKYCTFSLVSLVLRDICHENDWWVTRIRCPKSKGFPSLPPLTEGCGVPSGSHPGGRESCLPGIQQPDWQAEHKLQNAWFFTSTFGEIYKHDLEIWCRG